MRTASGSRTADDGNKTWRTDGLDTSHILRPEPGFHLGILSHSSVHPTVLFAAAILHSRRNDCIRAHDGNSISTKGALTRSRERSQLTPVLTPESYTPHDGSLPGRNPISDSHRLMGRWNLARVRQGILSVRSADIVGIESESGRPPFGDSAEDAARGWASRMICSDS